MKYLKSALPSAYNNARQALGKEAGKAEVPWEVRPSAHYSMGGIRVDEFCRVYQSKEDKKNPVLIEGLYAAGQAMGGLFGANRLGSTSLTELAVFGYRAGKAAAMLISKDKNKVDNKFFDVYVEKYKNFFNKKGNEKVYKLKLEFQKECWNNIGPARKEDNLKKMVKYLSSLEQRLENVSVAKDMIWNQQFIDLVELKNMIETARSVTLAALKREKSIGGHVRLDKKSSNFLSKPYSTIVKLDKNGEYVCTKLIRNRTKWSRLIAYKFKEKSNLLKARIIRLLPLSMKDAIIENKYEKILGSNSKPLKMNPGSSDAAPADNQNNY